MVTIKVFLASSITEFAQERQTLMAFFQTLNNIYHERDIFFQMVICESLSHQMLDIRSQEMYNQEIRESEYFYVIIGKQAGQYTVEEFKVALESYRGNGTPRIFTYFQTLDETESSSTADFRNYVSHELQHYYNVYTHVDTIKLNLLVELCRDPRLKAVMKVENGQALMNGQTILAMENIPLYNRNETVQKLLKEKEELDQEFADLAGLGDSAPVQRLRQKNAEKRGEIVKQLQELEMEMLDLCKHMEENRSLGKKLNWREKKAMELMDNGNYDAAKAILRDELWSSEVQHAKQIMSGAEEIIDEYISGKKALIQTIKATGVNKESAKEIILIYEDICQLAEKIQAELEVFIDFAVFLWKQHQYPRAIDVCEKGMLLLKLTKGPAEQIAKAKWLLGAIYDRQNESEKAEKLFRDALTDFQDLEKEYPGKYQEDIAGICNSLALIFYMRQQMDEAEAMHRAALKIRRTLAQGNHNIFDDGLAASCNNLGIVLMQKKEYEEAQSLLSEALKIRENLAANYPNQYESSLAKTYKNLGNLAKNKNQLSEAEHYYRKTIELFGKLKSVNPDAYEHDYANACERLAKLYQRLKQYDEAEKLYEEAEEIYSRWSSENFEAYGKYLGNLYHQWAELYSVKHQYEDAKTMYGKAYDLYAALEKSSPQMYLRKLSWIHGDIEKLERKKDKNVL